MLKYVLYGLLAVIIIIQFFQIDKSAPESKPQSDFMAMTNPPIEIKAILEQACYDCHSHKTNYPWYSNVQPVGWWLVDHVDDGRGHLNFSTWAEYDAEKQAHKVSECMEEVEEGEMPLNSYTWAHGEAKLTSEQREQLVTWFETLPHEDEH